jgi:acetate kinase
MKPLFSFFIIAAALGLAAGCSSKSAPKAKPSVQAKKTGQVRISHIKQEQGAQDHTGAVEALLEELKAHDLQGRIVAAIGHRVVHGGESNIQARCA